MLRILLTAIFSLLSSLPVWAQDQSRAILVLDASGSMWGQIDGVAKITIAQNVVGDLLTTLPENQLLGLMAYGHRRKGDCSDIELLLEPTASRTDIAARVNALTPRGKTPMTDAVIAAAEALRFTEEKATVILVSDGIETCNPNVCEAARALEQTGVDFTAHVIGFDVSNPEAIAQMQCLAEETGGTFRTASSAEELSDALQAVAEPEPAPVPVQVTFQAVDGDGGPVIDNDLVWTIGTDAAGILFENEMAGQLSADLLPGSGRVEVLRVTDEATAEAMFTVGAQNMTVTLVLPTFLPPATLEAPESAPAGSLVPVRWTGPDGDGDYITSADIDMGDGEYHHYTYTRDSADNTLMLRLPPDPGPVEIRYILDDGGKVLARRVIEVTPLDITFDAPDTAIAGSTIPVGWSGPDYDGDYLSIAEIGQN
ncbi:MAG TPA: VWA domain-containing protein, partial [Aliiroseovarius sp.]|nr:VWA domain-containing protein [Aliiroseovarius sp.]